MHTKTYHKENLDKELKETLTKVAGTIRQFAIDATEKANSGHPGLPLGCAEIGAYLYGYKLKHNPNNSSWIDRDKFILSAGHGSLLLYSCLHLAGFDLDIEERVIFTGFTKEVNAHIQLCNVTVLATPKETFGLVVIESMANGVPVIATDAGGPLEIIDNGIDGFFFDRTIQDLAKKIQMFYEDTSLQENIAKEALKNVKEKFDYQTQLTKLYEVINES